MKIRLALPLALALVAGSTAAAAQETITYTYDARGRLIGVSKSGGPANGVNSSYTYDAADNRRYVTVTPGINPGGTNPPQGKFVLVPLNGYTLIVLP